MSSVTAESVLHSRRSLYVGGLSERVNETILRAAMVPFGPIKSVDIPMDFATGQHKGFAFVEFNDAEDASEAIYNLDGSELYDRVLTVNLARNTQVNLNTHKAVWASDEFFQERKEDTSGEKK